MSQCNGGTRIPSSVEPTCFICMRPEFEWLAVDLCAAYQRRNQEPGKWSSTNIARVLGYRWRHRSQTAEFEQTLEEIQKSYSTHISLHIWHIKDTMRTMTTIYDCDKDFDERFFSDLGKASQADRDKRAGPGTA